MQKADELRDPNSCLNKAASDEPIFVIRAKDPLAAQTVRLWVVMAERQHGPDKTQEALKWVEHAEKWRAQNVPQAVEAAPREEFGAIEKRRR